jgi:hypothetical protein
MAERLNFRLMDFNFSISMKQRWHCFQVSLARQCICRIQFSVKKSVQDEFPLRTGAGHAHTGFGRGRPGHGNALHAAKRASTGRLDDHFTLHVWVDQAQITVVARGRKSEREAGVLGQSL